MKISELCDLWGMKSNASKTKTAIVSRSRTMDPQSPAFTIGGIVLSESDDLVILGVTFDSKMTFEKHLCSVSRAASQRLSNLRKSWHVFYDRLIFGRCFKGFVLPVLECCSAVWCSAADTHLKLLDRVVSGASFLTGGVFECDLAHRRSVAVLCLLYKIGCNPMHPLFWCSSCAVCDGASYTQRCDCTSVHLCASSLQNLAVPQVFYSLVSIWWNDLGDPVFDGACGTGGFQESGQ